MTIGFLQYYGKTPEDIKWVEIRPRGWRGEEIPPQVGNWEDFAILADKNYELGFLIGGRHDDYFDASSIEDRSLKLVGKDFWVETDLNDEFGTCWWVFKTLPTYPENAIPLKSIIRNKVDLD